MTVGKRRLCYSSRLCCLFVMAAFALFARPVLAATNQADLLVGMKTLPLLSNKITGTVEFSIIYDPSSPESQVEAVQIKAILDGRFEVPGDIRISSLLVPVMQLDKMANSRLAVLTGGLSHYYPAIGKMAASYHVLTMSTDLECVKANQCILGIVSKPHVEIYYSKIASDNAGISFGQVFTLLVKQI